MEGTLTCSNCSGKLAEENKFCPHCGFPENGDESDKEKFRYRIKLKKNVLEDAKKKLKTVKILLIVLASLNAVVGLFYLFNDLPVTDVLLPFISMTVFVGCIFWVQRQPIIGILAAFFYWIIIQVLVIFVDPALLFNGFILKILFIGIFLKGISSARDYKKYSDQLKDLKAN